MSQSSLEAKRVEAAEQKITVAELYQRERAVIEQNSEISGFEKAYQLADLRATFED
jgi:hypothetical protein